MEKFCADRPTVSYVATITSDAGTSYCADVVVSTTSPTPVVWDVDVDLSTAPLDGVPSSFEETINSFYGLNLKPFEVEGFLAGEIEQEGITDPKNFEEKAISLIGRPLYEAFIKGYTLKQWQKHPRDLPAAILTVSRSEQIITKIISMINGREYLRMDMPQFLIKCWPMTKFPFI